LEDDERLHYYDGPGPHVVQKVTFTIDGSAYYADTGYADITAWSTVDGELLRSFRGEACIGGFDLSSDESKLAYSSSCSDAHDALIITNSGGTIRFWDSEDGSLHYQLPPTGHYVEFLLSDDGSLLIVGDADGDVLIYGVGSCQWLMNEGQ
jgi:WD40 repeat protein